MSRVARHSSESEIEALEQLCERLVGFGADISLEWVDGFLTALLASRRVIAPSEWLPKLSGDAFERAFADPQDEAQALTVLMARWNALASQLDADSILDDPESVRLAPL
ncbi:MAG: zinc chelation protein SecC, partial [Burkholderiales bacterium PBB5]